jgi:hypothetical protein
MAERSFFPFRPEEILRRGLVVIGIGAAIAAGFAAFLWREPESLTLLENRAARVTDESPLTFALDLRQSPLSVPVPSIGKEMLLSLAPPRPDGSFQRPSLFVRLKGSAQSKRVALPARIDLKYENGLMFSEDPSSFWVELHALDDRQIEGNAFVSTSLERRIQADSFIVPAQESPIQMAHEFPEGSPFRTLAEGRWWGHDIFREKYGGGSLKQRLEVGPLSNADLIELEEDEWIAWKEGKWQKISSLSEGKGRPIAKIASRDSRSIVLEGWDMENHIRLSLPPAQPLPFKAKGDELFSSVRIRSEKQISCMLEKQCLILKTGDWVFKGENRWRLLRKKEEREAFLNGKLIGELFVFDGIEAKGGQKVILGHLFNPGRSQAIPLEIPVNSQRKHAQGKDQPSNRKRAGK